MTRLCVSAKDSHFHLLNVLHSHPTCLEQVPIASHLDNRCQLLPDPPASSLSPQDECRGPIQVWLGPSLPKTS